MSALAVFDDGFKSNGGKFAGGGGLVFNHCAILDMFPTEAVARGAATTGTMPQRAFVCTSCTAEHLCIAHHNSVQPHNRHRRFAVCGGGRKICQLLKPAPLHAQA